MVLGFSVCHIDCATREIGKNPWRLTCVYGEAQTHLRHKTWNVMNDICSSNDLPWLYIEDFNEVLWPDEHVGIGQWSNAQIQVFGYMVDILHVDGHWLHGEVLNFWEESCWRIIHKGKVGSCVGICQLELDVPLSFSPAPDCGLFGPRSYSFGDEWWAPTC